MIEGGFVPGAVAPGCHGPHLWCLGRRQDRRAGNERSAGGRKDERDEHGRTRTNTDEHGRARTNDE